MMKYIKLKLMVFKMELMGQMDYKFNFYMWMFTQFIIIVTQIIFMQVIFGNNQINGWSFQTGLILVATSKLVPSICSLSFFEFMYSFGEEVRAGRYDQVLTKPVNKLFWTTMRGSDMDEIASFILSIMLLVYAVATNTANISIYTVLLYLILVIAGVVILYSLVLFLQSFVFLSENMDYSVELVWNMIVAGGYPITLFKGIWYQIFLFVIPIGVMMALPAEVVTGVYRWDVIVFTLIFAVVAFILAKSFFYFGLSRYQSSGG